MGRKILGVFFILIALGLGGMVGLVVFFHGTGEALDRLQNLKTEQILWGVGAIFFLIVGASCFRKPKKELN